MYAVVDVELANPREKGSICSIGIVWVSNNKIVDRLYSLVRPLDPFEPFCVQIHHITEETVQHAPTFADLWPDLSARLSDIPLVAYRAETDIYSIEKALFNAGLQIPEIFYADAYRIAKRALNLDSYKLADVAEFLGVQLEQAHNALADAEATAAVMIAIQEHYDLSDLDEVLAFFDLPVYSTLTNGFDPSSDSAHSPKSRSSRRRALYSPASLPDPVELCHGSCDYFAGKNVLFTGNLKCTTREMAQKAVTEMGGVCKSAASKKINVCVVGTYDKDTLLPGATIGKKLKLILDFKSRGFAIDILSEEDFLSILNR